MKICHNYTCLVIHCFVGKSTPNQPLCAFEFKRRARTASRLFWRFTHQAESAFPNETEVRRAREEYEKVLNLYLVAPTNPEIRVGMCLREAHAWKEGMRLVKNIFYSQRILPPHEPIEHF